MSFNSRLRKDAKKQHDAVIGKGNDFYATVTHDYYQSAPKSSFPWLRFASSLACMLVLVISLIVFLPSYKNDGSQAYEASLESSSSLIYENITRKDASQSGSSPTVEPGQAQNQDKQYIQAPSYTFTTQSASTSIIASADSLSSITSKDFGALQSSVVLVKGDGVFPQNWSAMPTDYTLQYKLYSDSVSSDNLYYLYCLVTASGSYNIKVKTVVNSNYHYDAINGRQRTIGDKQLLVADDSTTDYYIYNAEYRVADKVVIISYKQSRTLGADNFDCFIQSLQ